MPVNFAKDYCSYLSQQYPFVQHFGALFARKQEGDYRWTSAHTIEVPSISVTGRTDANRSAITSLGSRAQAHSNSWTPLTLRNARKWEDFWHERDVDETKMALSIANMTRVFNEEQKFPERDAYLVSRIYADWCDLGRVPFTASLTAENVLTYFDKMVGNMFEKNVPLNGLVLYCTKDVHNLINASTQWYRQHGVDGGNSAIVSRAIGYLDSVQIEDVPAALLKTAYDFTLGAVPGATAKQIQMFLVHPSAVITPEVYETVSLDKPSALSQGKWMYYEESWEDVFILPNKQYGIEFCVADLESASATFTSAASSAADAVTGDCLVTITAPTGANVKDGTRWFYAVDSTTAPTAPGYGAVPGSGFTEWDGKATTVLNITNDYKMTLVATDVDGRTYAAGNGTITSKTSG